MSQAPDANYDPYAINSIEQLLTLFDGGEFLARLMADNRELMVEMLDHKADFGKKSAKGSFTLKVEYEVGSAGDLGMGASVEFKGPKKPPSSATAFVGEDGRLTLYSPLMKQMHGGVRDATPHDPETGEVRDTA